MYSQVTFSAPTMLCNCYLHLVPRHCITQRKPHSCSAVTPLLPLSSPLSPSLATTNLLFVFKDVSILNVLQKLNPTICDFLCLSLHIALQLMARLAGQSCSGCEPRETWSCWCPTKNPIHLSEASFVRVLVPGLGVSSGLWKGYWVPLQWSFYSKKRRKGIEEVCKALTLPLVLLFVLRNGSSPPWTPTSLQKEGFFPSLQALTMVQILSVCVCMDVKTSVPSGDDLIDVYTENIFNNLMPTSKEITPKSTLLFIYSLQICHSSIFALNCSVIVIINFVLHSVYFKGL